MPPVKPKSTPGRGQNPQTELEKQMSKEQLAETSLLEEQSTTTAIEYRRVFITTG